MYIFLVRMYSNLPTWTVHFFLLVTFSVEDTVIFDVISLVIFDWNVNTPNCYFTLLYAHFYFSFAVFTAQRYASAVNAMALCSPVSVRLSITSRSFIETDERIRQFFGTGASFDLCTLHYKSSSKNKGTSHRNFVSYSGLRKFRHGKWRVFSKNSSTFELVDYTCDGRRDAYVAGCT